MSIELKFPIPSIKDTRYASRTVGLYSDGKFLTDPSGRHDCPVEIWTAPANVGEGEVKAGWRDNQRCIAAVDQMAITMPMAVNRSRIKKTSKL